VGIATNLNGNVEEISHIKRQRYVGLIPRPRSPTDSAQDQGTEKSGQGPIVACRAIGDDDDK
jgi:hypothetical protein